MKRFLLLGILYLIILLSCKKNNANEDIIPQPTIPILTQIHLSPSEVILLPDGSKQLIVVFDPSNAENKNLTWNSSNNSVATVNSNGLVIGVNTGDAIITATSAVNPDIKSTVSVKVLKNYDVYVAGNLPYAVYWKNGIPTQLHDGNYNIGEATASSITVSGNDVYIAGTTYSQNNWAIATYWKNGVPFQLTNPANEYVNYATSIAVSNNTVYVAGYNWIYTNDPSFPILDSAFYWKINGNSVAKISLNVNGLSSKVNAIATSGTDVYVAGAQWDQFYGTAKFWKNDLNGVSVLSNGNSWAQATAITTKGSDIMVAGFDGCPYTNCTTTIKFWKNNSTEVISLTDGNYDAEPTGIAVSGDNIYVSGWEKNSIGNRVAKCWKINGSSVSSIPLSDGQNSALTTSIAVSGDDIFISGYEYYTPNKRIAKYWRLYNNFVVPVELTSNNEDGEATSIFIK